MAMATGGDIQSNTKIGFETAVARMPPSPTAEWGKAMDFGKLGDRLTIPKVGPIIASPRGVSITPATLHMLEVQLPLNPDQYYDDDDLLDLHRWLHRLDILAFDKRKLHWDTQYDIQRVAWMIHAMYDDPLFGRLSWAQSVPEEIIFDAHHRDFICEEAVRMMQDEREKQAAKVMSAIDKEVITRGLAPQTADYWRQP